MSMSTVACLGKYTAYLSMQAHLSFQVLGKADASWQKSGKIRQSATFGTVSVWNTKCSVMSTFACLGKYTAYLSVQAHLSFQVLGKADAS